MGEDGTVACPYCAFAVRAGGFEVVQAGFPRDFDDIEHMITGASRFGVCPQCLRANVRVERIYVVSITPAQLVLLRPPTESSDEDVGHLLDAVLPNLPAGWRAEVVHDIAQFREAVGLSALASVRLDTLAEIVRGTPRDGLPPLAPVGPRDRAYHAALALVGRPGVLVFTELPDGATQDDARSRLEEARRFQLTIGFFEVFAGTPLAGFDPYAAVEEHFVPACFEDERVLHTIALVARSGKESADPVVIDAALGAAAGERRSPRRRELAEGLVAAIRRGVEVHDDPTMWRGLVDTEDILRNILAGRSSIDDEEQIKEMAAIASTLGHGVEVLRRYGDRLRIHGPLENIAEYVDLALAVAAERGSAPQAVAEMFAQTAASAAIDDAVSLVPLLLDRLEPARLNMVVPTVRTLAKRLTDSGEPRRALSLLDDVEEAFDWDALDPHASATGRASLLNERGNALHTLLDTQAALTAYDEALVTVEGQGHDDDVRLFRLNRARALRDAGHLPRAIAEIRDLLDGLDGRARFDALFALGLAFQRNGQWQEAQAVLDEAAELAQSEPLDDQLTRFLAARQTNIRNLGREEQTPSLLDAVRTSPFVSARLHLLTLGAGAVAALRCAEPSPELSATTVELARRFGLPARATHDPELALTWAEAVRLAGDTALARDTVETALATLRHPLLGLHAATTAAEMAIDDARWEDVDRHVEQAAMFMTEFAGAATVGATTVTLADTLADVRHLGVRLAAAPEDPGHDRTLSTLADLGSSLQLSLQIAREHLPVGGDVCAPEGTSLQVLQWVDGGEAQVPLLVVVGDGTTVHRGKPLHTGLVHRLGERIAGRLDRTPALDSRDVLENVAQFRAFRDAMAGALVSLPIDPAAPLTVVPSAPMVGVPVHMAMPDRAVALSPSLAVAVSLAHEATAAARQADAVGEIRCWSHGDFEPFVTTLTEGGERLRALCTEYGAPYEVASGTAATRAAVAELVKKSTWLKLSCHGVAERTRGRFGLLLSDGQQAPPSLPDVFNRPDYGPRYLYDWTDIAHKPGRCRAVLSTACMSGSSGVTLGGEQTGLARAFLTSGILWFVAPLWPVAVGPAQLVINELLARCLAEPALPLARQLERTRSSLRDSVPPRVADAFVLHGHSGPVNPTI
ncbi:CHAT domain-containing protein [Streptomyces sp. A2-16]|uniref:CHAT domain-containing protein n=1 Tax=Streptomyces sp. A2-16 TaxID=2781734 RepID=UPI001BAEFC34|nr:CHAT domain-containing protein [Streptomyces sp. A2-16]QUC58064.1 CHAT domain-containing protein [Streptomyces sp. A2-16]